MVGWVKFVNLDNSKQKVAQGHIALFYENGRTFRKTFNYKVCFIRLLQMATKNGAVERLR